LREFGSGIRNLIALENIELEFSTQMSSLIPIKESRNDKSA
jgi:hypothetical protein